MCHQPDILGATYNFGIFDHVIPQLIFRANTDQAIKLALFLAPAGLGKHFPQAVFDHPQVVRLVKDFLARPGLYTQAISVKIDSHLDKLLGECRVSLAHDVEQKNEQKNKTGEYR